MNTVFFSIRLAFAFSFTGSSWIFPCILAWQNGAAGHSSHLGSPFGTHTIAPSSMSPWLKSPAQSFGITFLSFSGFQHTGDLLLNILSENTQKPCLYAGLHAV